MAASGEAQQVVLEYERFLASKETAAPGVFPSAEAAGTHARIVSVRLFDGAGLPQTEFSPGDHWTAEVDVAVDDPARPVQVHIAVSTPCPFGKRA